MEVSIWQVLALRSGKMAGLQQDGLQAYLDKALVGMEKALEANPAPGTKAGLVFCMQLCGKGPTPVVRTAIADLSSLTPDWDVPAFDDPIFRWFLITHSLFENGGKSWIAWNQQFAPLLANHQVKQDGANGGKTVGYWDSPGKTNGCMNWGMCWGHLGGGAIQGSTSQGFADGGELLMHGASPWHLILFGLATIPLGLFLWHGQGPHFGLGDARGKVSRSASLVS